MVGKVIRETQETQEYQEKGEILDILESLEIWDAWARKARRVHWEGTGQKASLVQRVQREHKDPLVKMDL